MPSITTFVAGAGIGAAAAYFLDKESGKRRRALAGDKGARFVRQGKGGVQSAAQSAGAQAQAVASQAKSTATGGDSAPGDDNTLKSKVETEIFRAADAPKGDVVVSVANGIVELRGQVADRSQIEALELKTRMVTGVKDVRNMLHLPGETPANLAGAQGSQSS